MNSDLEIIYEEGKALWGFDIFKKSRKNDYIFARAQFYFLARKYTTLSLQAIGEYANDRDHATVLHALKNFPEYLKIDRVARNYNKYYDAVKPYFILGYKSEITYSQKLLNHLDNQVEILRKKNQRLMQLTLGQGKTEIDIAIGDLSENERTEVMEYRVKPFLQMLKSRKHYATK